MVPEVFAIDDFVRQNKVIPLERRIERTGEPGGDDQARAVAADQELGGLAGCCPTGAAQGHCDNLAAVLALEHRNRCRLVFADVFEPVNQVRRFDGQRRDDSHVGRDRARRHPPLFAHRATQIKKVNRPK